MTIQAKLLALKKTVDDNHTDVMAYIDRIIADHATPPTAHILDVPWLSQLGPDAAFAPGDCGPACLAMWLRWLGASYLGNKNITVDQVSNSIGLSPGYRYTMPAHLIWGARYFGYDLYWKRNLSLDHITAEIDAGQPVIVLVHYGALPEHTRIDPEYTAGHWLLVVGYDDENITYHDPYHVDYGRQTITREEFLLAWSKNYLDGNSNRQALRLRR